jgi:hypothetical protein
VFEVGQEVQAIDYPCGLWREGTIKKKKDDKFLIAFKGIYVKSKRDGWVNEPDLRWPVEERRSWMRNLPVPRHTLVNILKDDFITKSKTCKEYVVGVNDPFKGEFSTSCGDRIMYEIIAACRRAPEKGLEKSSTDVDPSPQKKTAAKAPPPDVDPSPQKKTAAKAPPPDVDASPQKKTAAKAPPPDVDPSPQKKTTKSAKATCKKRAESGQAAKAPPKKKSKADKPKTFLMESDAAPIQEEDAPLAEDIIDDFSDSDSSTIICGNHPLTPIPQVITTPNQITTPSQNNSPVLPNIHPPVRRKFNFTSTPQDDPSPTRDPPPTSPNGPQTCTDLSQILHYLKKIDTDLGSVLSNQEVIFKKITSIEQHINNEKSKNVNQRAQGHAVIVGNDGILNWQEEELPLVSVQQNNDSDNEDTMHVQQAAANQSVSGKPETPKKIKLKFTPATIPQLKAKSVSQQNFAKKLFFEIYGFDYLKTRNVRGDSKKDGLDPDVIDYVKYIVLNAYLTPESESRKVWQDCISATNRAISDKIMKDLKKQK